MDDADTESRHSFRGCPERHTLFCTAAFLALAAAAVVALSSWALRAAAKEEPPPTPQPVKGAKVPPRNEDPRPKQEEAGEVVGQGRILVRTGPGNRVYLVTLHEREVRLQRKEEKGYSKPATLFKLPGGGPYAGLELLVGADGDAHLLVHAVGGVDRGGPRYGRFSARGEPRFGGNRAIAEEDAADDVYEFYGWLPGGKDEMQVFLKGMTRVSGSPATTSDRLCIGSISSGKVQVTRKGKTDVVALATLGTWNSILLGSSKEDARLLRIVGDKLLWHSLVDLKTSLAAPVKPFPHSDFLALLARAGKVYAFAHVEETGRGEKKTADAKGKAATAPRAEEGGDRAKAGKEAKDRAGKEGKGAAKEYRMWAATGPLGGALEEIRLAPPPSPFAPGSSRARLVEAPDGKVYLFGEIYRSTGPKSVLYQAAWWDLSAPQPVAPRVYPSVKRWFPFQMEVAFTSATRAELFWQDEGKTEIHAVSMSVR